MNAKEVGLAVQEFADNLVEENVKLTTLRMDDNTTFIDHLGSALIMEGTMLMLEAGCPPDIVLKRSAACIASFLKSKEEEAKEDPKKLILVGGN
jgi:hypothetical protein